MKRRSNNFRSGRYQLNDQLSLSRKSNVNASYGGYFCKPEPKAVQTQSLHRAGMGQSFMTDTPADRSVRFAENAKASKRPIILEDCLTSPKQTTTR